jgi:hypothetical protein
LGVEAWSSVMVRPNSFPDNREVNSLPQAGCGLRGVYYLQSEEKIFTCCIQQNVINFARADRATVYAANETKKP